MLNILVHITPASSDPAAQLWTPIPLWLHSAKAFSVPSQWTSSRWISGESWGLLWPCRGYDARRKWYVQFKESSGRSVLHPSNSSCLQTTAASLESHLSSHTEPHKPSRHISTLPSVDVRPFTSRTSPSLHSRAGEGSISFMRDKAYRALTWAYNYYIIGMSAGLVSIGSIKGTLWEWGLIAIAENICSSDRNKVVKNWTQFIFSENDTYRGLCITLR